ncbi:hypothetical protein [Brevibacillus reuszeri]|uniref:hypothetical protein n=1 Tax=Brevibacillus reuszeri TaxID=54915 RepID=UPI0028974E88|nr:hypothetical protein [Brevibacillus reuszeri]
MKHFIKLNVVSILYALMIFVPLELMVNVYRISRITGIDIGVVTIGSGIATIVGFILGTTLFFFLTNKWLNGRKMNYWTIILWVPYFVLFGYLFASYFPITYGGDDPNPATGLVAIGALLSFPFYILIINLIGSVNYDKTI